MTDRAASTTSIAAGPEEVRHHCGDLADWKVAAILATGATARDLAAAAAWVGGQDDLGQQGAPLEGVAAQVYDILMSDEEYDERR